MSVKKILSVLFLIASPICILFLVLLAYFSIADPDILPALVVFLPIDLVYLLLFWKSTAFCSLNRRLSLIVLATPKKAEP